MAPVMTMIIDASGIACDDSDLACLLERSLVDGDFAGIRNKEATKNQVCRTCGMRNARPYAEYGRLEKRTSPSENA